MRHTENDLRDLLTERAEGQDGAPAHLDTILRRGRRIRRTRRAVTAGAAALAVAALAVIGLPLRPEGAPVAQQPVDSAHVEPPPGPEIPATFEVRLGAEQFDLPLIHSERFDTVGPGRSVTFSPTSTSTGYKVVCEDPRAWVVTAHPLKGGERGGAAARCGRGLGGQHDHLSVPAGWLERPQSLQVWVFPSDAPVLEVAQAVKGCRRAGRETGCDESALPSTLLDPKVRKRLEAEVGERPGRWAVAIYDRPASSG
ncbi:hypothetical protein ACU635_09295 [[Actinomadura] parvosata]|uniref:hypothetical protein n=1 Tax=[Actinomadura] parvosata TaxID=1955412 RepID=UPI00406C0C37